MKKKLVLSALILLVGSSLFITRKENISKEITVEDLENNKSMAIYIKDDNGNYNKATNIPTSGYTLNTTKSVCTNNATPSWNIKTNSLKISNLTSKDTGCYLYFDVYEPTAKDTILENNTVVAGPASFTGISASDEARLLSGEDDDGTTYYFRGAVTNNWVQFAGFYWRIIRINGDRSIRMIYNGTTTDQTGVTTHVGESQYSHVDATEAPDYNYIADNTFEGYMYGTAGAISYDDAHSNTTSSAIKNVLDTWYKINIVDTGYSNKVSLDAGFCNDRSIANSSETWYNSDTKKGYGKNATAYGPWSRILTSGGGWNSIQTPKFTCTNANNDLFTLAGATKGNKRLTYPVGLITADEVIFAGGFGGTANNSYYLYTNQAYWTMSPCVFSNSAFMTKTANLFFENSSGAISFSHVGVIRNVRPVINLASDVKFSGSGTTSNPYRIEGVE